MPGWLTPLDHTADEGFTVVAPDAPALFTRCAWALFAIIADLRGVEPRESETLAVEAPDLETLLVRWLTELNYRHQLHHRLYTAFEVALRGDTALTARIGGENIDRARHEVFTEIKAVTFHGLRVQRTAGGGWQACVIVDV